MPDLETQLRDLFHDCELYEGGYKVDPLPEGPAKEALGHKIIFSPLLAQIGTAHAARQLPKITDPQKSVPERVHLAARLLIDTICEISGYRNYARLLASGMTPKDIETLADEIERGEY